METPHHFRSTQTDLKSLTNNVISYKNSSVRSFCTLWSVFTPMLSSPVVPYTVTTPPFGLREMLCTSHSGDFCSAHGSILDFKEVVVPRILWVRGKGCCVLHRTKHSWRAEFTVWSLPVILWHFRTLNCSFSGISGLVLYMALITIVHRAKYFFLYHCMG